MAHQQLSAMSWIPVIIKLVLICCYLADAFTATDYLQSRNNEKEEMASEISIKPNMCNNDVCKARARLIASYLNESSKPCEDFYSFVCSGWKQKHILPEDKTHIGTFQTLMDTVINDLGSILNYSACTFDNQTALTKVIILYRSCLKDEYIQEEEREVVVSMIREKKNLTVWPRLQSETKHENESVEDIFNKIGWNFILVTDVDNDNKNISNYIINVYEEETFRIGREELLNMNASENVQLFEAYKKSITEQIRFFNKTATKEIAEKLASDIIAVQVGLANISTDPDQAVDYLEEYTSMTLGELQRNFSLNINWTKLLNKIFSEVNITLTTEEKIVLWDYGYFKRLDTFLLNVDKTALYNFIGWTQIASLGEYASKKLLNLSEEFDKVKYGGSVKEPAWKTCISKVRKTMGMGVGKLYVQQNFTEAAKNETEHIVNKVKAALSERVSNRNWMDNTTKKEALKKLKTMLLRIGYPDWIFNDTALEEEYQYIGRVDQNMTFLEMSLKAEKNLRLRKFEKLRQHYNRQKNSWSHDPADVNALYGSTANIIVFLAGILQAPVFSKGLPPAINFGAIGSVIGHEITHAFDESGSQFDSEGNLTNWWSDDTRKSFNNLTNCFRKQYGCTLDEEAEMYLNGNLTISENIADNGGIKGAFKAYKDYVKDNQTLDQSLPYLNYSSDQLFFISLGMVWCENARKQYLKDKIEYDTHAPNKHRVNLPLQNMEEFAQAFNCSKESRMVKEDRCELW